MRVAIIMSKDGTFEVISDQQCDVYFVDDNCPNDRVYMLSASHTVSASGIDAILMHETVGHAGDKRHEAVKRRILSAEDGKNHLKPVT